MSVSMQPVFRLNRAFAAQKYANHVTRGPVESRIESRSFGKNIFAWMIMKAENEVG